MELREAFGRDRLPECYALVKAGQQPAGIQPDRKRPVGRPGYVATDIAAYTRNLAGNFRPAIEKAGLRFDVETGPAISGLVYLDEGMWEKIVFNLLSNAFMGKYTLEGSITVRVSAGEEDVVLTVTDTGVGISG